MERLDSLHRKTAYADQREAMHEIIQFPRTYIGSKDAFNLVYEKHTSIIEFDYIRDNLRINKRLQDMSKLAYTDTLATLDAIESVWTSLNLDMYDAVLMYRYGIGMFKIDNRIPSHQSIGRVAVVDIGHYRKALNEIMRRATSSWWHTGCIILSTVLVSTIAHVYIYKKLLSNWH